MQGRTILITGCSSGIGLDAARGLAARGWRVFATCRQEADCARLRDEGLESFVLDYASQPSIAAALDEALRRTGGTLDALYNNGAFACPGAVEDLPRGALREICDQFITIPTIGGASSLSLSHAGAIVLGEAFRQRMPSIRVNNPITDGNSE